jgi:hypothetical protein
MRIVVSTNGGEKEYLLLQLQGTVEADNPELPGQKLGTLQIKGKVGKSGFALICRLTHGWRVEG